jgi:hypothetical protein
MLPRALDNLTPADVFCGRAEETFTRRKEKENLTRETSMLFSTDTSYHMIP